MEQIEIVVDEMVIPYEDGIEDDEDDGSYDTDWSYVYGQF